MTAIQATAPATVERTATIIAFPQRPWWATAANPPCVSWCEREHEAGEFAENAAFVCWRTVHEDKRLVVRARSYVGPAEDGAAELGERESAPYVDFRVHHPSKADVAELVRAFQQAESICEGV